MIQVAFTMKLKAGCKDEYKRRHEMIWPELQSLISESGIVDYSIFLDEETNTLFAVNKNSGVGFSDDLSTNPLIKKWWSYMADIMETNPDHSPIMKQMELMYHMD